jgi:hypothetical protein
MQPARDPAHPRHPLLLFSRNHFVRVGRAGKTLEVVPVTSRYVQLREVELLSILVEDESRLSSAAQSRFEHGDRRLSALICIPNFDAPIPGGEHVSTRPEVFASDLEREGDFRGEDTLGRHGTRTNPSDHKTNCTCNE